MSDQEFDQIMRERRIRTVFQPIEDLTSREIVGYEALVRGPENSHFASAPSLLAAAYRHDRVTEFDWLTRASACRAAMAADLDPNLLLFLNIEPIALDSDCPRDLWPDIKRAFGMFSVILEVTERSLDRDPGTLFDGIERQRRLIAGIALDDVGGDPVTLSMLPLVAPGVIKMDLGLIQANPDSEALRVLDIVHEEAERTGATVLAEGIQSADHLALARSFGAQLGQGYYLGKPAPLRPPARQSRRALRTHAEIPAIIGTPFEALEGRVTGRAGPDFIEAISRQVGACGGDLPTPAILVCLLPSPDLFGKTERERLAGLVERGVLTAVLGPGLPADPGYGIRGVGLRRERQLTGEWAAIALGPCSSGAMLARVAPDDPTQWDYGITHDKRRIIAAARCLFRRLGEPEPHFQAKPELSRAIAP